MDNEELKQLFEPRLKGTVRDIMEVKAYTPDNHNILASWWKARDWPVIPPDHLPKTGFVAWQDKHPIAACFLYTTDSVFGMMEWAIADPAADKETRHEAMDMIIHAIMAYAKNNGIASIYTMTNHPSLIQQYRQLNFTQADLNMRSFIKRIE